MFKTVEYVYKKGINNINEDELIIDQNKQLYAVIAGATGFGGLSGKLAASTIKEGLLDDESQGSLLKKAQFANRLLRKRTVEFTKQVSISELPKEERISCGIAAVNIIEETNQMEYIHAGDCMLFLQYIDGSIRTMTYNHIFTLDSIAITKSQQLAKPSYQM